MRAARCRQAMESGAQGAWIYPRYPRYPQAVCPFNGNIFVTAISPWPRRSSGNGGEPSQPQPRPSGIASHQAQGGEAEGRAADEAAARRTMAGLPFSGCESGRLREAPIGFQAAFGHVGNREGRTPDLRVQDLSGRKAGLRSARRHRWNPGLRPEDPPGRTGLRPGGCETGGPRVSAHGPPGRTEASAEDPAGRGPEASAEGPQGWEAGRKSQICRAANRQGFGPVGEPAGNPDGASAPDGPRRKRRRSPRFGRRRLETAQRGTPRLPG